MKWKVYLADLEESCEKAKLVKEDIIILERYAESLYNKKLPIIFNNEHLGKILGFDEALFLYIQLFTESFYHKYKIRKKSGGYREINEPYPTLKEIQNWIRINILQNISVSKYAKAYIPNKGIIDNVKFHKEQKVIIKLDIKDFFGSIKKSKVNLIFLSLGYTKSLAYTFASLCCLNDALPQGAPTSPSLSNVYFRHIDKRIGSYTKKLGFRYTRYSDDITISGDISEKQIGAIIKYCTGLLRQYGLDIKEDKTKILRQSNCQYVTGVVLNKKITAGTKVKREIRQIIYYIKKYGLYEHMQYVKISQQNYLLHVLGRINWVLYLEKNNKEFMKYKQEVIELIKQL